MLNRFKHFFLSFLLFCLSFFLVTLAILYFKTSFYYYNTCTHKKYVWNSLDILSIQVVFDSLKVYKVKTILTRQINTVCFTLTTKKPKMHVTGYFSVLISKKKMQRTNTVLYSNTGVSISRSLRSTSLLWVGTKHIRWPEPTSLLCQENKTPALRKHIVLHQHHGQLLPSGTSLGDLLNNYVSSRNGNKSRGLGCPVIIIFIYIIPRGLLGQQAVMYDTILGLFRNILGIFCGSL